MNNKIVFVFVMGFILSISALQCGETPWAAVTISIGDKVGIDMYKIKDVRKIDEFDLEENSEAIAKGLSFSYNPSTVTQRVVIPEIASQEDEKNIIFKGNGFSHKIIEKYEIMIQKADWEDVRGQLKAENAKPFKNESNKKRTFQISLMNEKAELIRLDLTQEQGERLSKEKKSYTLHILGLSFAGLVALIYYFDLYSKGTAFLGRN